MAASAAAPRILQPSGKTGALGARCRPFLQVCRAGRPKRMQQLIQLDELDGLDNAALPPLPPVDAPPPQQGNRRQPGTSSPPGGGGQRYNQRDNNYNYNNGYGGYTRQLLPRGPYYDGRNTRMDYNDLGGMRGSQPLFDEKTGYWLADPLEEDEPEPEPLYVGGKRLWVNQEIAANEVRLQTETGESMGIVSLGQALEMADEEGVDVVCLNEELSPPLCRLVSASKYKYEWERAQKASKKKQRETQVEVKEVRLRPITDTADLETKSRNAQKFLQKGNKVKITMSFTGREQRFKEQGRELLLKLIEDLSTLAALEGPVSVRGSTFSAVLAPLKK